VANRIGDDIIHVHRLTEPRGRKLLESLSALDAGHSIALRVTAGSDPSRHTFRHRLRHRRVFGVYEDELGLAALAHGRVRRGMVPSSASVLPGIARAASVARFRTRGQHARNRFAHACICMPVGERRNDAHREESGMNMCVETGEAEAFSQARPADQASLSGELMDSLALFDYP